MDIKESENRNKLECSSDFMIRVIPGPEGSWHGQVEHVQSGRIYNFRDYPSMILFMQEKLEESGIPHADDRLRTWPKKAKSYLGREQNA